MQVVVRLPSLPRKPPPKPKPGTKAPRRPTKMDWSCHSCKGMICLEDTFDLGQARKEELLPVDCPLSDPYFQSKTARYGLLDTNKSIKLVRVKMRELEYAIKDMRKKESSLVVQRHRQLDMYWEKVTLTKVTEKKAGIRGKDMPLPTFKITVTEIRTGGKSKKLE